MKQDTIFNKILTTLSIFLLIFLVFSYGWFRGLLVIFLIILGLYTALYLISRLFQTTKIISFIFVSGSLIAYPTYALFLLYITYLSLRVMFIESFWQGLLYLFIGIPITKFIISTIFALLGAPLFWLNEILEKRFRKHEQAFTEIQVKNID